MHVNLAAYGSALITRARGARIREAIISDMAPGTEVLVLDFADVESASYSMIDELYGGLLDSCRAADRPNSVSAVNADPVIAMFIEQCETRRGALAA